MEGTEIPKTPFHPGEILKDEMEAVNLSARQLATDIHVPLSRIKLNILEKETEISLLIRLGG
jgi:plasmid maintenance system antidote protein VapI